MPTTKAVTPDARYIAAAADEADAIADQLNALTLTRIDPNRFHEQRSSIAARARRLAKALRGDRPDKTTTTWRSRG